MSDPLDIQTLKDEYLNRVFDEREFVLAPQDAAQYALSCGEQEPRFTDPGHPDFRALPTMAATLQPYNSLPDGFPRIAGMGMDAGRAVTVNRPIRPGTTISGRTHMHDIYTKTGRSGRMVFFVKRMRIFDGDGVCLGHTDTSSVIREKPQ